jgi:hypothetical protein
MRHGIELDSFEIARCYVTCASLVWFGYLATANSTEFQGLDMYEGKILI